MAVTYPIAPGGIFVTFQGEGALLGVPMRFVRLAGCSLGCSGCDTDYRVERRLTVQEIGEELSRLPQTEWFWITGGEPADHDLWPLLNHLRQYGRVALATSGHKRGGFMPVDFLSVSPHGKPDDLQVHSASQINLVPGLGGLKLDDWRSFDAGRFSNRYVTPCDGKPETLAQCLEFVRSMRGWRLGIQAHKVWGLP